MDVIQVSPLDEGPGHGARLGEVLPEGPLLPLATALHGERSLVRVQLRGLRPDSMDLL